MKKNDSGEYKAFSEALQKVLKMSSELEKNKKRRKKPAAR